MTLNDETVSLLFFALLVIMELLLAASKDESCSLFIIFVDRFDLQSRIQHSNIKRAVLKLVENDRGRLVGVKYN